MSNVTVIGKVNNITTEYTDHLLEILGDGVYAWKTPWEDFKGSTLIGGVDMYANLLAEFNMEDTTENRALIDIYIQTDYVEYIVLDDLHASVTFGQGDYEIKVAYKNIKVEDCNIFWYDTNIARKRIVLNGLFLHVELRNMSAYMDDACVLTSMEVE